MLRLHPLAAAALLVHTALALAQPQRGDYLIASRTRGTIYAVNPVTGAIRSLVSGLELRDLSGAVRGDGASLAASFRTSLAVTPAGGILARFATSATVYGVMSVAADSGDRTRLPGTAAAEWDQSGDLLALADGTVLTAADAWDGNGRGYVLRYDLASGLTTIITGPALGDGPILIKPQAVGMLDETTLLVAELNLPSTSGSGLYRVDVATGNRTFVSRLTPAPFVRQLIVNGQFVGPVTLGDDEGGSGPVLNLQPRSLVVMDGRILIGESIKKPDLTFTGGILEVDPSTGNRTLLVGYALADDGTGATPVLTLPSNADDVYLDDPIALIPSRGGRLAFTCLFGPNAIFEFDLNTRALFQVADIGAQIDPSFVSNLNLSGLALYLNPLGDLNCDGLVNSQDIDGFIDALFGLAAEYDAYLHSFAVYHPCSMLNADFSGDGLVNAQDIDGFVSALFGT